MATIRAGLPGNAPVYGSIIYAPRLTFHDPNPPITIEDAAGFSDTVLETVAASESQSVIAALAASISETAVLTVTQTANAAFFVICQETITATDSTDAQLNPPASAYGWNIRRVSPSQPEVSRIDFTALPAHVRRTAAKQPHTRTPFF